MAKQQQKQAGIARFLFAAIMFLLALGCAYLTLLSIQGRSFLGVIGFGVGVLYFAALAIQSIRGGLGQSTLRSRS